LVILEPSDNGSNQQVNQLLEVMQDLHDILEPPPAVVDC